MVRRPLRRNQAYSGRIRPALHTSCSGGSWDNQLQLETLPSVIHCRAPIQYKDVVLSE